jgi:hypothetical protein
MMSTSLEETAEFPSESALEAQIGRFRRLLSEYLGCTHDRLVFDDINDVYCSVCGKDFTD